MRRHLGKKKNQRARDKRLAMEALERASENAEKLARVNKSAAAIGSAVAARTSSRDAEQAAIRAYALGVLRKSASPDLRRGAVQALIDMDGEPAASLAADEAEISRRRGR
jgi:hypothetical protein